MKWVFSMLLILIGVLIYVGIVHRVGNSRQNIPIDKIRPDKVEEFQSKVNLLLEMRKKLALPAIPVEVSDKESDQLFESRLGGMPAWPKNLPKPNAKGRFPLAFLAQINLSDMPKLESFPDHGLLQFYFAADDLYGLELSGKSQTESDIKVIWHENLDDMTMWNMFPDGINGDGLPEVFTPFEYDNWWEVGYKLKFGKATQMSPTFNDYRIYEHYWAIEEYFIDTIDFYEYTDQWRKDEPHGIVIGGHPFFVQSDPREYISLDLQDYTHGLVAFDSGKHLMWGDVGTGSFIIRPEDLAQRNFETILYNYDSY